MRTRCALIAVIAVLAGTTLLPRQVIGASPDSGDRTAVMAAVHQLLDAWRQGDVAATDAVLHPQFRLTTMHFWTGKPEVSVESRASLLNDVRQLSKRKPGYWDDRLLDTEVRVDGRIAHVWAHYRFSVMGHGVHCGVESIQLYRDDSAWQIIEFSDTHIEGDCTASPRRS